MIVDVSKGNQILQESVSEVFETMVFMDVEPKEHDPLFLTDGPGVMSSVAFSGNFNGVLTLLCDEECAKTIAMNMLAMDDTEELEDSEVTDTMGEVANMTMGTVKSKLYDIVGELAVSVPMVVSGKKLSNALGEGDHKLNAQVFVGGEFYLGLVLIYKD